MISSEDLSRTLWTDADFDVMGWHDNRIIGLTFPNDDMRFSIDFVYIFHWEREGDRFTGFWVSPCRLIFENVFDLEIALDIGSYQQLDILNIDRSDKIVHPTGVTSMKYEIGCGSGFIKLRSTGYRQQVLKPPVFSESQDLPRPAQD